MTPTLQTGQILKGALFNEPMRVETVRAAGAETWTVGLVGTQSERFRNVTLTARDLNGLTIIDTTSTFAGDGRLLRLGLQAYALGIAYEFDPYFGLSISRVDPLPHQLEAVYDHLLKLARVRFLLADDAGAGKTIMAGLLIRELKLRGLAERVLIVCPANLAFQWQRELKEKFDEKFVVLKGDSIRDQFGINQWLEQKLVITSLDLAKRSDILPGLNQVHWDLVIVDEAHRMSWTPPARKTARYALGELLRDSTDHFLLLTATPHKGDPENFSLFLQLLDRDAYADVKSIRQAIDRRYAPFYLRRTKEAMVYFPERQADGTWVARKIFTKRIPRTIEFQIDNAEFEPVSRRDALREAAEREGSERRRRSARPCGRVLDDVVSAPPGVEHLCDASFIGESGQAARRRLAARERTGAPGSPDIPDADELDEMEDSERERLEAMLEAISLAQNADQVRDEIAQLNRLAQQAGQVETTSAEAKLARLEVLLHSEGFYHHPDQRLLIFTEFKDTLDYLVKRLKDWGFSVGTIHGGMPIGSRDQSGSRLYVEQQFREGAIQVLVATEAAGEGINLQVCHILFNYDIPWNPNRLEQRMGRIHRYGQTKDCLIFNFVATNTIEGRVLQRLLEKLQEIRDALDDDSVFNVVGEVLPAAHVERVLRDYYAGKLGDADLEERLLRDVDEGQFRAICQNALEGLASKKLNLEMLIERRALAQERRVVPETIARFMTEAAEYAAFPIKPLSAPPHTFEPGRIPTALRRFEQSPDWKLPQLAQRYPRCTTDRDTAEAHNLEWVTPGHPLFEALRRHTLDVAREVFGTGACFYSLQHAAPARIDFYRARVVDGLGQIVRERLFVVEVADSGERCLREASLLGNFTPAKSPASLPAVAQAPESTDWLNVQALLPFLQEAQADRSAETDRIAAHIELSLTELIQKADEEIGRASEEIEQGVQGAEGRLAQAETRHAELTARRDRRRQELERQRSLTLQGVERLTSVLVLPHPEREAPDMQRLRPNFETEAKAMQAVMDYERAQGRQVYDVHEKDLGYDITSLDLNSGELRLIEVKGLGAATGTILLTPNERRVAEDRPDCFWLYVVTNCSDQPVLQEPIKDPARYPWHEVMKVQHYWLEVNAMTKPMQVRDSKAPYAT